MTTMSERTPSTQSTPQIAKRSATAPEASAVAVPKSKGYKRIIVCCDGTWQDGLIQRETWKYTNVLKMARSINYDDERQDPPIPQVVFYQTGVGAVHDAVSKVLDGATGATLGEKVQEAYAFIAHNFKPGDEIFLFGFSRGAYTARMVASVIGEIGVLDRRDMDSFAEIFIAYQKRGKSTDPKEIETLNAQLQPWTSPSATGRRRADIDGDCFTIKCVGVFDTVGAFGLPGPAFRAANEMKTLFGFNDKILGAHIERAVQALALNEPRGDFDCAKFQQTEVGRSRKQILKQCWFSGCHSDIGGGYESHDLSDLSLIWMAAQVGDILSLDTEYLAHLPNPVDEWGKQRPHDPRTGVFILADTVQRQVLPDNIDTQETIHPSVLKQPSLPPHLQEHIQAHPEQVCGLLPLEEEVKVNWRLIPEHWSALQAEDHERLCHPKEKEGRAVSPPKAVFQKAEVMVKNLGRSETMRTENGRPVYHENWLGKMAREIGIHHTAKA